MTTVNISKRLKQNIQREILFDWDKVLKDAYKCLEDDELHDSSHYVGRYSYNMNWSTTFYATIKAHEVDCHYSIYGDIREEYACICEDKQDLCDIVVSLRIKYNDRSIYSKSFNITELTNFGIGVEEKDYPTHFSHRFWEEIPDSVIICICGEKGYAKAEKKCRRCYIESHIRTEEEGGRCSICLQNKGGVWFKTPCKHFFHQHCIIKALEQSRKCPWCRTVFEGGELNPYNVSTEAETEAKDESDSE